MYPWAPKTMGLVWPVLVNIWLFLLLLPKGLAVTCQNISLMVWAPNVHTIPTCYRTLWAIGQGTQQWNDSWFTTQGSNMLYLPGRTTKRPPFTENASARPWEEMTSVPPRRGINWLGRKLIYQGTKLGYELLNECGWVNHRPIEVSMHVFREMRHWTKPFHVWTMLHCHLWSLTWQSSYNISTSAGLLQMKCNEVVKRSRGFTAWRKAEAEWFDVAFQLLSQFSII